MTRLQKKCLFAAAGAHLLVMVVLLCSGWIKPSTKVDPDDMPVLTLVNLTDAQTTGSKSEPTPTPPQPVTPPPDPTPTPPIPTPPVPDPPKPVVTPVPQVKPVEPVKQPDDIKPADNPDIKIAPPKKKPHEIKVDKTVVTLDQKKAADDTRAADAAAAAKAKRDAQKKADAFKTALRNISSHASSATDVNIVGTSSVSFANYASVVKSIYERAWIEPSDADNDNAIVKVSVTISNDGHVTTSSIVNPSGDSKVDRSVQRTLDRVDFVAPFPDGAKEKERTFIINFNLSAKRLNG